MDLDAIFSLGNVQKKNNATISKKYNKFSIYLISF